MIPAGRLCWGNIPVIPLSLVSELNQSFSSILQVLTYMISSTWRTHFNICSKSCVICWCDQHLVLSLWRWGAKHRQWIQKDCLFRALIRLNWCFTSCLETIDQQAQSSLITRTSVTLGSTEETVHHHSSATIIRPFLCLSCWGSHVLGHWHTKYLLL